MCQVCTAHSQCARLGREPRADGRPWQKSTSQGLCQSPCNLALASLATSSDSGCNHAAAAMERNPTVLHPLRPFGASGESGRLRQELLTLHMLCVRTCAHTCTPSRVPSVCPASAFRRAARKGRLHSILDTSFHEPPRDAEPPTFGISYTIRAQRNNWAAARTKRVPDLIEQSISLPPPRYWTESCFATL